MNTKAVNNLFLCIEVKHIMCCINFLYVPISKKTYQEFKGRLMFDFLLLSAKIN